MGGWRTQVLTRHMLGRPQNMKEVNLITDFQTDGNTKLKFGGLIGNQRLIQAHIRSARTIVRSHCPASWLSAPSAWPWRLYLIAAPSLCSSYLLQLIQSPVSISSTTIIKHVSIDLPAVSPAMPSAKQY
jgi:hypothetical protein